MPAANAAHLVDLIGDLLAHRRRRAKANPTRQEVREALSIRAVQLVPAGPTPSGGDPEEARFRAEIRAVGESLHAAGGMTAMREAFAEILDRHGSFGASAVDHAWNCIGEWVA